MNSLKLLSTVTRHNQATKVFVRKINNQNLIPKVDFSWKEDKIIDTISKAAQSGGPGFFYLENHGIDSSVFENAIEQSNLFYSTTSMEQKEAITNHGYAGAPPGKSSKGYVRPGIEGSYPKDNATDQRPQEEEASGLQNLREALVFRYPELSSSDKKHLYIQDYNKFLEKFEGSVDPLTNTDQDTMGAATKRFYSLNQWPNPKEEKLSNFRPNVEVYFSEMNKLAQKMFGLFSSLLKNQDKTGENVKFYEYDTPMSTFNLAHYPSSENDGLGIADHTDWELFTLLYPSFYPIQHNVPCYTGLEVWFEDKWVRIPHLPGTIIVNQGEMLSRFSNGKFRAPVHRVDAKHKLNRISLVSFWAPNYDTLLPDPEAPKKNVISGEYYLMRNNMV